MLVHVKARLTGETITGPDIKKLWIFIVAQLKQIEPRRKYRLYITMYISS